MPWVYLSLGIVFSVFGTVCTRLSDGATKLIPVLFFIIFQAFCFYFISHSMRSLGLGVVYALWCGIGIIVVTLISVIFFAEKLSLMSAIYICLILVGIIGLKLNTISP